MEGVGETAGNLYGNGVALPLPAAWAELCKSGRPLILVLIGRSALSALFLRPFRGYARGVNNRASMLLCALLALTPSARAQQDAAAAAAVAELAASSAPGSPFRADTFVPDADTPSADFAHAWPSRVAPRFDPKARGVIVPIDVSEGSRVLGFSSHRLRAPADVTDADRADATALLGDYRRTGSIRIEGAGSILFSFDVAPPGDTSRRVDRAAFYFKFVSGKDVSDPAMPRKFTALERTWFAFYDAVQTEGAPQRPVVLVIPGMFGTPEPVVNGMVNRLRLLGWPVLRMLSHPSRFTQTETIGVDAQDPDLGVTAIARLLDDRAAECAYAASAAFEYVEGRRPGLKGRPRSAIGFSGGAMALPTVVALEPGKYESLVMVGGGCDYFLICERSNYASWIDALRTVWTGELSAEQRRMIDRTYLSLAKLDAYNTAPALRGKRTLLIQGSLDRAVPSDLGDLLWRRLGKPERWLDPHTHESLFLTLPGRYDAIIDFLAGKPTDNQADKALPASPSP